MAMRVPVAEGSDVAGRAISELEFDIEPGFHLLAIRRAGGSVDVYDYPASVHAFFNDARPEVFQPDNAALAWQRTLDAFRACTG